MKGGNYPSIKYIPLLVLIVIIFIITNPAFFQNSFEAKSPNSFLASDAYAHLAYINDILRVGSYNEESQFIIGFTGKKLTPIEPPLMLFQAAFLSNLLGIKSHVAILLVLLLGIILAISTIYIIIRKYSLIWAIGFLPCTLFLFTFPFIAGITWGFWKAYYMFPILIIGFLFFLNPFTKARAAMFIIILSCIFLASPALMVFFLLLFCTKIVLEKQSLKKNIITLLIAGIASLVLISDYLLNYIVARGESGTIKHKILEMLGAQQGYQLYGANPYVSHFGVFWYIALAGFIYGIFYLSQNIKKRDTYQFKLFSLFSIFFLIFLLPAIGLTRIHQFRLVWPLFVSIFIGLILYLLVQFSKKKVKIHSLILVLIPYVILIIFLLNSLQFPQTNLSITTDDMWETYNYINNNTSINTNILIVNPVLTQNGEIFTINRKVRYFDANLFSLANSKNISLVNSPSNFPCQIRAQSRSGFKVYSNEKLIKECEENRVKVIPPCAFDYILVNKQFQNQNQVDLTQEFISELNINNFKKIKESQQILLLQNNQVCNDEI